MLCPELRIAINMLATVIACIWWIAGVHLSLSNAYAYAAVSFIKNVKWHAEQNW